jgi:hypothetical protein
MSEILATSPRLEGEASTVEGRLADAMDGDAVVEVDEYKLSDSDRAKVVAALRLAARRMDREEWQDEYIDGLVRAGLLLADHEQ